MREQLIQYVELLFAGAPNSGEVKQEILQNTLDRYDDLLSQGKQPEAAYRLAISGIGDINEILGSNQGAADRTVPESFTGRAVQREARGVPVWKKVLRAVGIFLYIICPIPLFVLETIGMESLGLSGTLAIVAVATALMVIAGGKDPSVREEKRPVQSEPGRELRKAIKTGITTVGFVAYFILSFATQAWYITWLIFPIMAAANGLVRAILDLKEAGKYEN